MEYLSYDVYRRLKEFDPDVCFESTKYVAVSGNLEGEVANKEFFNEQTKIEPLPTYPMVIYWLWEYKNIHIEFSHSSNLVSVFISTPNNSSYIYDRNEPKERKYFKSLTEAMRVAVGTVLDIMKSGDKKYHSLDMKEMAEMANKEVGKYDFDDEGEMIRCKNFYIYGANDALACLKDNDVIKNIFMR